MRLFQAIGVFFKVLGNAEFAKQVKNLDVSARPELPKPETTPPNPQPAPARNDAVTLLAALQREARFLDIVNEPLGDYTDAQIGAAAKDVLADSAKVIERFFVVKPVVDADEGTEYETPDSIDPNEYQITGNVSGDPPFKGTLVHKGWRATSCQLPKWSGSKNSAMVIAPAEVELSK